MVIAVVLDLDDTLTLEVDFVRSGFAAVAREWRSRNPESDTRRRCWTAFQASPRGVLDRVGRQLGLPGDVVARAVEIYRTHRPDIVLCPDAVRFLHSVRRERLAIISDGDPRTQRQKVDVLGLRADVALVVLTGERDGWAKPSVLAFEHVLTQLGAEAAQSVYIGDNGSKDFVGAKASGMRSIQVVRSQGVYRDVPCHEQGLPDIQVGDLDQALLALSEWGLL